MRTATEIVKLCTGTHTVRAILAHLAAMPGAPPTDVVEQEVLAFLERLAARGLLRDEP